MTSKSQISISGKNVPTIAKFPGLLTPFSTEDGFILSHSNAMGKALN